ncbi:SRPBCC domain-containing protein [Neorhizobium sp. T25_13]|uniref:SRPBCC family protein n=1 Tax=Neorhizobium sp. T25_13 TaxID=2093830 RepID=UPI000CF946EE|nr:SRPBCC domain-containing protein [Neorhizobium sp. T25_13]
MTDQMTKVQESGFEQHYDLDAPPEKVWRAISISEFREKWLPKDMLADPEPVSVTPGERVRYRLRDGTPPFLESFVTFAIAPNAAGGTSLRILHELTGTTIERLSRAVANANSPPLMLAA